MQHILILFVRAHVTCVDYLVSLGNRTTINLAIYLQTSLDKTYQDLEDEARQRSHVERRLQSSEQQLDFIRQILNERDPDDALERARKALVLRPGGAGELGRSRTSSGRPIRPSTNFSISAGSLLDPEDVSLDRENSRLR